MKRLKKSLAFITTISMLATLAACNSDNKDSSKEETTTEATTEAVIEETTEYPTEKNVTLDKTYSLKDISFLASSNWTGDVGDSGAAFVWLEDSSTLGIQVNEFENPDDSEDIEIEQFSYFYSALCNNYDTVEEPEFSSKGNLTYMETNCTNDKNTVTNVRVFFYNNCLYSVMSTYSINGTKTKMSDFVDEIFSSIEFSPTQETDITEAEIPKEYANALKKAKSYSDNMYMSKAAIHDQLTSEYGEGFSEEAADYAVENLVADYKANALHKAKSYQDNMAMSTSAIYDQLVSEYGEQFTEEEAQYAIDNLD